MKPLRKSELFASLSESQELTKVQVKRFLEALTDLAYKELRKNGQFALPDLGKFTMKERKARMGRNPATGESIKIPRKMVLKFRVAKACKDACLPVKK